MAAKLITLCMVSLESIDREPTATKGARNTRSRQDACGGERAHLAAAYFKATKFQPTYRADRKSNIQYLVEFLIAQISRRVEGREDKRQSSHASFIKQKRRVPTPRRSWHSVI